MKKTKRNRRCSNNKKRYSTKEKIEYHTLRLNGNVSEGKKTYSRHWLKGYKDPFYSHNLASVKYEINDRRKNHVPFSNYDIVLLGYKNGLEERNKQ